MRLDPEPGERGQLVEVERGSHVRQLPVGQEPEHLGVGERPDPGRRGRRCSRRWWRASTDDDRRRAHRGRRSRRWARGWAPRSGLRVGQTGRSERATSATGVAAGPAGQPRVGRRGRSRDDRRREGRNGGRSGRGRQALATGGWPERAGRQEGDDETDCDPDGDRAQGDAQPSWVQQHGATVHQLSEPFMRGGWAISPQWRGAPGARPCPARPCPAACRHSGGAAS